VSQRADTIVTGASGGAPSQPRGLIVDRAAIGLGVALGVVVSGLAGVPVAQVIRSALSIPKSAQGLDGLINALHNLETPAMVAAAALSPLAVIAGGAALAMGHRLGPRILFGALVGLVVVGVGSGIVE
jgi:hypothetical protein